MSSDLDDIRSVVDSIDRPLNVLILPGGPTASALFEAGVARVSLGSALSMVANAALVESARELLEDGTHDFWTRALASAGTVRAAFSRDD